MTVIHTETHLTSDPVYGEDSLRFHIALSSLSIECHMHREENIRYFRENKIRIGDLVSVNGVFMTENKTSTVYYIIISSLTLLSNGFAVRKRKRIEHKQSIIIDDTYSNISPTLYDGFERRRCLISPASMRHTSGLYIQFEGEFSDYFFMLYGKVCFITSKDNAAYKESMESEKEKMMSVLTNIYSTFIELTRQEATGVNLNKFVGYVANLTQMINTVKQSCSVQVPQGMTIDQSVPLPTVIYINFINE